LKLALSNIEQTRNILLHHWEAFGAGNIEEIMADYADDAILVTPEGTRKGEAQIRSLFEELFDEMFSPASSSLNLSKQVVEGKIAYILWSGSSSGYDATFATDTFVIRDGKIIAQTFAAQIPNSREDGLPVSRVSLGR
jgi:hypothetical protein